MMNTTLFLALLGFFSISTPVESPEAFEFLGLLRGCGFFAQGHEMSDDQLMQQIVASSDLMLGDGDLHFDSPLTLARLDQEKAIWSDLHLLEEEQQIIPEANSYGQLLTMMGELSHHNFTPTDIQELWHEDGHLEVLFRIDENQFGISPEVGSYFDLESVVNAANRLLPDRSHKFVQAEGAVFWLEEEELACLRSNGIAF